MDLSAIRIKVQADTKEAKNNLENLKKTGESISKIGAGLTLGLTTPIFAAGTACLMTSNEVSEMESKFDTVFKTTAKAADAWATKYANAIGRSRYEVKSAIANQSDLMIGMGMQEKAAGELSQKYISLAYDLASFNNVNDAQAIEAVTKACMGETESMKMLGVNLSETIMENSKFVKSSGKAWKEMTMAEKAAARYEEAVAQSTNAIGDAERTQGGFANQLKRMKGNFNEISVEVGKMLLPTFEKLTTSFNGFLTKILDISKENPKLIQSVIALGAALASIGPGLLIIGKTMTLLATFPALIPVFAGVASAIGLLGLSFLGTNEEAQKFISELPQKISEAINNTLSTITAKFPEIVAKGTEIVMNLVNGVITGVPILLNFIGTMIVNIIDLTTTYMPQFILAGFNFIMNILIGVTQKLPDLVSGLLEGISNLLSNLTSRMPEFLARGVEFIKNLLDGAIQKFPELLQGMIDGVLNILANIRAKMPEFLSNGFQFVANMISGIAKNMPSIIAKIGELVAKLIATLVRNLPKFLAEGAKMVVELINGLWKNKGKLLNAGKDLIKGLINSVKETIKSFINIGKTIVDNIKQGVANAWGSFTSWVSNKVSSIPIIGKFFRSLPEPENGESNGEVQPVPTGFGVGAVMARSPFSALTEGFSNFQKTQDNFRLASKNFDDDKLVESNKLEFNLNIENFNNNTKQDVEELMDDIAFMIERKFKFG